MDPKDKGVCMRIPSLALLVALAACGVRPPAAQVADRVDASLLGEMRRLAEVPCPTPSDMPVLDGTLYMGWYGAVVGVDDAMLAVRITNPERWSPDVQWLLMTVSDRRGDSGIKGNAVVVGRVSDTLVCRFFPSAVGSGEAPAVGDTTWVDHATSRELRASWHSKDHP